MMGRIKTLLIKRITHELMSLHGEKLTDNFEKNKKIVNDLVSLSSKKLRNIMAGYATRLVKQSRMPKKEYKHGEDLSVYYSTNANKPSQIKTNQ